MKILKSYGVNAKLYGFTISNQDFLRDNIYVFSDVDAIQGITDILHYEILKKRLLNGIKILPVDYFSAEHINKIEPLKVPTKIGVGGYRYPEDGIMKEVIYNYEDFDL